MNQIICIFTIYVTIQEDTSQGKGCHFMARYFVKINLLIILSSLFVACTSPIEKQQLSAIQELNDTLKMAAANNREQAQQQAQLPKKATFDESVLPTITANQSAKKTTQYKKFNLSVKGEPAQQFFLNLMKGTNENIVVSPEVSGTITLNLSNVNIITVLEAVKDLYGYEWEKVPYGFKVYTRQLETRIFKVDHLNVERKGQSSTSINPPGSTSNSYDDFDYDYDNGNLANRNLYVNRNPNYYNRYRYSHNNYGGYNRQNPGSSIKTKTETNFWGKLEDTIWAIIGKDPNKTVNVNASSGIIIVKAYPDDLRKVNQFLHSSQNILGRQVMLEAKILELTLSRQFQFGINWSLFGNSVIGKTANIGDGNATSTPDSTPSDIFKLNVSKGDFGAAIRMLSQQGKVTVLSSPRISTTNNQKAIIKVGSDQFFLTGLNAETVPSGTSNSFFNNVSLQPFFSGVALGVTPHISADGTILMHIHPVVSRTEQAVLNVGVGGNTEARTKSELTLPTAKTVIRESDSIVRARNNQVIIIGGLMENSTSVNRNTLGNTNVNFPDDQSRKTELIILLKPIYVKDETWQKELDKLAQNTYGGKPPCKTDDCVEKMSDPFKYGK